MISSTPSHSHTYFTVSKHIYKLCLPHPSPLSEGGMHLHKAPLPPYRRTRTVTKSIRFGINLQYAQNGSLLKKIVDPSLDTSLKVFIFVPTRSFGRPSFTRYRGIVPSDCLTQKRESYPLRMVRLFVKKAHPMMSSLVQSGGIRD